MMLKIWLLKIWLLALLQPRTRAAKLPTVALGNSLERLKMYYKKYVLLPFYHKWEKGLGDEGENAKHCLTEGLSPRCHCFGFSIKPFLNALAVIMAFTFTFFPADTLHAQEPNDTPTPPPQFNPSSITTDLCAAQCYTTTVQMILPPSQYEKPPSLDVFIVMDITGSMEDELNTVKSQAGNITQSLRELVPDLRIGFGTYSDYGTFAWREDVPFTSDFDAFQQGIQDVTLDEEGGQEPGWRALYEISQMTWRPNAQKITVLFTDERFLQNDPGRDERYNTQDDISPDAVLTSFENQSIHLIAVNAGGGENERQFLQEVVKLIDGTFFDLESAGDIPQVIVGQVGATLADYFVTISPLQGDMPSPSDWVTLPQDRFAYPYDGEPIDIELEICPQQAALSNGDYELALQIDTDGESVGTVPLNLSYVAKCVDLLVRDTPQDDGTSCVTATDAETIGVWSAPSIQLDSPDPFQAQRVLVNVENRGLRPAKDVTVRLYQGDQLLMANDQAAWTLVGEQQAEILPQQDNIEDNIIEDNIIEDDIIEDDIIEDGIIEDNIISFDWTPPTSSLGADVILRVEVESAEDALTAPNSPACDGNISQLITRYIRLNQPSVGDGYWRGEAPFNLTLPPTLELEGLHDLRFEEQFNEEQFNEEPLNEEQFNEEPLNEEPLNEAQPAIQRFELLIAADRIGITENDQQSGNLPLVLSEVFGADQSMITLQGEWALEANQNAGINLILLASDSEQSSTITGASLQFMMPPDQDQNQNLDSLPDLDRSGSSEVSVLSLVIPLLMSMVLLVLIGVAWTNSKKARK